MSKSFAEFSAKAEKKVKSFCAGACTWRKILLRLQVWNLFAADEQIMRAADCKKPPKRPTGGFGGLRAPQSGCPYFYAFCKASRAFLSVISTVPRVSLTMPSL